MKFKGKLKKLAQNETAVFAMEAGGVAAGAFGGDMTNLLNDKVDFFKNNAWVLPTGKILIGATGAYFGREIPAVKGLALGVTASGACDLGALVRNKISNSSEEAPSVQGIGKTITIDEDYSLNLENVNGAPVANDAVGASDSNDKAFG